MFKFIFFFALLLSFAPLTTWACETCVATSQYCTSYSTVCTSYNQQCDAYATTCNGYATVCDSYSQQCTAYDDQGNCVSYDTVCTSYSQQCTGYSQQCTSYSTVCTSYGQQCDNYQTQCDQYEYADYITVHGTVKATGSNRGIPGLTVSLDDTQSDSRSTGVTDSSGNYTLTIYAYDTSAGFLSVNTCVEGQIGFSPTQVCSPTLVYDSCTTQNHTVNLSISPASLGNLDGFGGGKFFGWALDPKNANTNISVHFYEELSNGTNTFIGTTTANIARPDVNQVTGYPGNHGFAYTLPAQYLTSPHKILAYAVSVDNRYNPLLANSPFSYPGSLSGLTHAQAVGSDNGADNNVRVYNPQGSLVFETNPYPGYRQGVRVAVADVNADGVLDVITAPGQGGGPHVKVFSGKEGSLIHSFFAYSGAFQGGVFVASADINNDGKADIITGADAGGGPHVRVFSGANLSVIKDFYAYPSYVISGVRVAAGDVDHDGYADIITAPGPGNGPHVKVFSGNTGAILKSFYAYASSFTGGVYVGSGDVNGDGWDDIITGPGAGGGPHVIAYSGQTGAVLHSFFAYTSSFTGGVRVGTTYLNADTKADILTAAGPSGGPHVKGFNGINLNVIESFFAQAASYVKGLFISGK